MLQRKGSIFGFRLFCHRSKLVGDSGMECWSGSKVTNGRSVSCMALESRVGPAQAFDLRVERPTRLFRPRPLHERGMRYEAIVRIGSFELFNR